MEEFQNYNSVVVNLEPSSDGSTGVTTATYDQAFLGEEFSELRGRGAERRKQRQLAKQQRQAKRQETGRRARKARRQTARQEQRSRRQEARMGRKESRMNQRNQRRTDKQNQEEDGGSESTEDEELPQNGGSDTGYDSGSDSDTGYDSGSDTGEDTGSDNGEDQGYDSGDSEDGGYEEADESFAGDSSNFSAETTGRPSVPDSIQAICNQIEMNNQLINQLMKYKTMLENNGQSTAKINDVIVTKSDKVESLENKLENFSGADGKVDPMKAKVIDIATNKAKVNVIKRKIAWHQDKIVSLRQKRDAIPRGAGNNVKIQQIQNQIDNQKAKIAELQGQLNSGFDGDEMSFASGSTPAQIKAKIAWHRDRLSLLRTQRDAIPRGAGNNLKRQQLQNQIDNQKSKIVELQGQLGTSGFDGEYGINLDAPAFDYDQPQPQIVDLDATSNFSGSDSSNSYLKTLLIGGAIAIATIYVVRKYNLLK